MCQAHMPRLSWFNICLEKLAHPEISLQVIIIFTLPAVPAPSSRPQKPPRPRTAHKVLAAAYAAAWCAARQPRPLHAPSWWGRPHAALARLGQAGPPDGPGFSDGGAGFGYAIRRSQKVQAMLQLGTVAAISCDIHQLTDLAAGRWRQPVAVTQTE
jgi:hypothetical protein